MKKILIIAGLAESLVLFREELIASWLEKGYRVVAAAPGNEVEDRLRKVGIYYHDIPLNRTRINPVRDFNLIIKFVRLLKSEKPDILFFYTIKPVIYGSLASYFYRQGKVFSMITGLGYLFIDSEGLKRYLKKIIILLYRIALKRNEKVFFQNPDDNNEFQKFRIIDQEKAVQVNGSGVNLDYYRPLPLPADKIVFLMIARLIKEKGIAEYFDAAAIIKERYPGVVFQLIAWSFDDNPSAIDSIMLEEMQVKRVVEVFEKTEDVRPFIGSASVYVLPSYREGTPRTVLEAMAMGRAIITTDAPGCRETVISGVNGYLIPPKDSKALANAMEQFIKDPRLIEMMGRESRKIAEEKYSVHEVNIIINRTMGIS